MAKYEIGRRSFLKGMAVTALSTTAVFPALESYAKQTGPAQPVPNSAGTDLPKLKAPPNACDCHMHIYDPERFPFVQKQTQAIAEKRHFTVATASEYRLLQKRLGTTRVVVVTPANYITDNRCTLDAVAQMAPNARGVVVIHPDVTDAELKRMNESGIRGIRFTVFDPVTAVTRIDMIEPLSKRIAPLGWHIQLHMRGDQILENADMIARLPVPVVFDHMARMPQPQGIDYPAFKVVLNMVDKGHAWVKLAGAYLNTQVGPPAYPDATKIAQALVKAAPERVVWGSDWPHPTEKDKPNDALLFDLLGQWAPDKKTRHRILVENPQKLYGFPK